MEIKETRMKVFFAIWFNLWIVLSLLVLPFPFKFLPKIGERLSELLLPLNKWFAKLYGIDIENSYLISDSFAFFSSGILLFLFSLLLSEFLIYKWSNYTEKSHRLLHLINTLVLCYFLLHYGLEKLLRIQFYMPAANTLHTEMGQMTKDLLFWSSMGTSKFYNLSTGALEFGVGILLLFNRTRFTGYLLAIGVFAHILMINIGFDITVKYLSSLLLLSSMIGFSHYKSKWALLVGTVCKEKPEFTYSIRLVGLLLIPITLELATQFSTIPQREIGKSYLVLEHKTNTEYNFGEIKRIHMHPDNFLVLETKASTFKRYKIDVSAQKIYFDNQRLSYKLTNQAFIVDGSTLFTLKEIDLSSMPLLQDETHLFIESYN